MKKGNIVLVVVFCLLLFGCTIVTFILPKKEFSVAENRELQGKPKLTGKKVKKGTYQKQYEKYLNDQFFLRDAWVRLAVGMQSFLGQKDINGVYLGKDGYLLEKPVKADFDEEQTEDNVVYLSTFLNEAADIYGKKHVSCMMIPSKAQVLTNRLPDFAEVPNQDKVLDSLRSRLTQPEMLLDMSGELQKHQQEYIYYRTDHHWTTLGACYAYAAWAKMTGQAVPHEPGYYRRETAFTDFYGTTYNKVPAGVPADQVELFHSPDETGVRVVMDDGEVMADSMYFKKAASEGFNRYNVFFSKNTFQIEVITKAQTEKSLLLIKDSFANCFVPFLTEEYERIIMIDYRYGKVPIGRIMSQHKELTDVLVVFNTEKFMQNTKLAKLADVQKERQGNDGTMEEFDPEDFLE